MTELAEEVLAVTRKVSVEMTRLQNDSNMDSESDIVLLPKPIAHNAKTVGRFITCGECQKPRVCMVI